ncbi:MAG: 2,3-bisphosphoglycerate-independent phosphoglycerate mutase [Bacteroidetes bacterium]|nr:2,3-bisphosphoglycerate-independent phosphoglycerate mutase [Bacteroidota bacterium]
MVKKTALVILDGWGIGDRSKSDAVWNAKTPFTDSLWDLYPHTELRTDGENVGLPDGQMGNSEVGHMNLGAGRIVWQMLVRINKAFADGEVKSNPALNGLFQHCISTGTALHLMGLVSDGGVHSHQNHLIQLCKLAGEAGVQKVYIHAFMDGRDTDPKSGKGYLDTVLARTQESGAKLSTVIGRYFAMDRDKRWERVAKAWQLMVNGTGTFTPDISAELQNQYDAGITDEFMSPLRTLAGNEGLIRENDTVLCFNYRTDRGRQITSALSQQDFPEHGMNKLKLKYYTMTEYDARFEIEGILFANQNLNMTLGEVLANAGLTQLRAAETEKYPHVTFFFNGGREEPFPRENRLLVNSPKVATYDLQPEMSATELADKAIALLNTEHPDFVCLNFANPDMVGHTGVYNAIVRAVETVDSCLHRLVDAGQKQGYTFFILADHGNADFAINDDGTPNTAHTTNPVPCWVVGDGFTGNLRRGILADVAPTVLKWMGLEQPFEMTGSPLF